MSQRREGRPGQHSTQGLQWREYETDKGTCERKWTKNGGRSGPILHAARAATVDSKHWREVTADLRKIIVGTCDVQVSVGVVPYKTPHAPRRSTVTTDVR